MRLKVRGTTVLELMIGLSLFSIILVTTTLILNQTIGVWRSSDSKEGAALRLRQSAVALERDVTLASSANMDQTTVAPSLSGGGFDGDAFWFLSAVDPATNLLVRNEDGAPVWQRNILYYLVVPSNHTSCKGVLGPNGYDEGCSHKMLLRQVIDNSNGGVQELLADVTAYLGRPNGVDTTGVGGPGTEQVSVVSTNLLWFRVLPAPTGLEGARLFDLRAVALDIAQRNSTGNDAYAVGPNTLSSLLTVRGQN